MASTATRTRTRTRKHTATAPAEKFDPYQAVTDRMIALMEAGTNPWRKPWSAGGGFPRSIGSGKAYRGINPFLLLMTSAAEGYTSPWWGTYKAIAERGGQVRKGEKGTLVVFWSTFDSKTELDAKGAPKKVFFLKTYRVFNAAQADGLPEQYTAKPAPRGEAVVLPAAAAVVQEYLTREGITLTHGGNRAAYSPAMDTIVIPDRDAFTGPAAEYYATVLHELAHSTGHESRLNRPELATFSHFGDASYSREELVAELGAAMVCGVLGIERQTEDNSAAYLASWVKVLRGDAKLVVQAAAKAQRAADRILGDDFTLETDDQGE